MNEIRKLNNDSSKYIKDLYITSPDKSFYVTAALVKGKSLNYAFVPYGKGEDYWLNFYVAYPKFPNKEDYDLLHAGKDDYIVNIDTVKEILERQI